MSYSLKKKRVIHSCIMKDLSESLTVAHLSWLIWANRSQLLIWSEGSERMSEFPALTLWDSLRLVVLICPWESEEAERCYFGVLKNFRFTNKYIWNKVGLLWTGIHLVVYFLSKLTQYVIRMDPDIVLAYLAEPCEYYKLHSLFYWLDYKQ